MDCLHESRCLNASKCYRCFGESLLKLPEDKQRMKHKKNVVHQHKVAQSDNSWEDLEDQVALKLNQVPTMKEARRARASGALWFEKGDIVDSLLHPECKERKGRELKTGDKSMSIQREWLEKAKDEVKHSDKKMCLPFRFKGDDQTYVIMEFDDVVELAQFAKAYMQDNDVKGQEIELLRKQNEQLKAQLAKLKE